jgi:glycogen debranching enzyme
LTTKCGLRPLEEAEAKALEAGFDHIEEIADADPPHTPRGCPFQAWSVGLPVKCREVTEMNEPGKAPQESGKAIRLN